MIRGWFGVELMLAAKRFLNIFNTSFDIARMQS